MNIETIATSAVESALSKTDWFIPAINSNDNQPSWDGHVYVYRKPNDKHPKLDLNGRIPVQIKGQSARSPFPQEISYSVEIIDLSNYLDETGCMYFVVYYDKDSTEEQIYYKSLLPYDIRKILKEKNEGKKVIRLRKLPSDKTLLVDVFQNFISNRTEQHASVKGDFLTIGDVLEDNPLPELSTNIATISNESKDIDNILFENGLYVYKSVGYGLLLTVDHLENIGSITRTKCDDIRLGDKLYYDSYQVTKEQDGHKEIKIGKSLKLLSFENKIENIRFVLSGKLSERLTDLSFAIDLFHCDSFHIDDILFLPKDLSLNSVAPFDVDRGKIIYEKLTIINSVLSKLHVQTDLDIDAMTDNDRNNLLCLIDSVYFDKWVDVKNGDKFFGFFNIANLSIIVNLQKDDERGLYKIGDFFAPYNKIRVAPIEHPENGHDYPAFIILKHKAILKCCNLDPVSILESVKQTHFDEIFGDYCINFFLELLLAYDKSDSKRVDLLEFAERFLKALEVYDKFLPPELVRLNRLQIVKRQRLFDDGEIEELNRMAQEYADNEMIATGVYLLLDDQRKASYYFNKLPDNTRDLLSKQPIFRFWIGSELVD